MKENKKGNSFLKRIRNWPSLNVFLIWLVFFVALAIIEPKFVSFLNITNLLRQTAITGVIAVGMTFVVISSGIDLSVGSVLAFAGMTAAMMMQAGIPIPIAILVSILVGTLIGFAIGVLIHKGKVPPFIATLGGMTIIRGLVMLISGANKVPVASAFGEFATTKLFGIPAMAYVWLVIVFIGLFLSKHTVFGRNVYAIGSNEEASRLSGINVGLTIGGIYAFNAFCAAVAGLLMATRLGSGTPTAGMGIEMDAIAAVVVGGASLSGAVGSITGTVFGTIIIAMIRNGGQLMQINSFVLDVLVGLLIVVAVLIDKQGKKNKK